MRFAFLLIAAAALGVPAAAAPVSVAAPRPIPELEPVPAPGDEVLAEPVAYDEMFPLGLGSIESLAMPEFHARNIPGAALWGMAIVLLAFLSIMGAYWRAMRRLRRSPRRVRRTVRLLSSI
ncbi:MAG TPA: hypothetical protein VKB79_06190 [Bryobacteraceae bacterium]|nr:hypothetical protein [Bryobacteraceae bacterium]